MLLKESINTNKNLNLSLYLLENEGCIILVQDNENSVKMKLFKDSFNITDFGLIFNHGFGEINLTGFEIDSIKKWLTKYEWAVPPTEQEIERLKSELQTAVNQRNQAWFELEELKELEE